MSSSGVALEDKISEDNYRRTITIKRYGRRDPAISKKVERPV
jgi:hypothetical protein